MDVNLNTNGSKFDLPFVHARAVLEIVPAAAAIWNGPRTVCALNQRAQKLIGFSEADLLKDNRLWGKRVYCGDRIIFLERQKKMEKGNAEITCDYRFSPKGSAEPIWLREVIVPLRAQHLHWKWISLYSDISDLKQLPAGERQEAVGEKMREVVGCLFHDIRNRLHLLSMEFELTVLESGSDLDLNKMTSALQAVDYSIKVLHDYLFPGQPDPSSQIGRR